MKSSSIERKADHDAACPTEPPGATSTAFASVAVKMIIEFAAELWLWDARLSDSWTFVSVPVEDSAVIREVMMPQAKRGFGSVRVHVTIGRTTWSTSIFPDARSGTYALPIKKAVRVAEGVEPGHTAHVRLELIDI